MSRFATKNDYFWIFHTLVDVNIADNDISTMLKGRKNGIMIRQDSSSFLNDLYACMQSIVSPA